jgi:ribosomal protein S12 methylthiotransferase
MVSLGCPKNLVDSEVMLGLVRKAGHELTSDASGAEIIVVNTCSFVEAATRESIDAILEMARHKQEGSCRRLIVVGCLAERYRAELRREIPEIDAVLGTDEVPAIVDAINAADRPADSVGARGGEIAVDHTAGQLPRLRRSGEPRRSELAVRERQTGPPSARPQSARRELHYLYDGLTPRVLATPSHYAYLKIAEGCDYSCSFCIIPSLRGSYRSRPADSIVAEARALAERGVRELLLVSQDTTFYGVDRHERGGLATLLHRLNSIDGIEWIRMLYLHPATLDEPTLAAIAECDKACKYIDLPLQHASDRVLRRMRRPGSRRSYEALLSRIRTVVAGAAIRTTFIVGYPGETDGDMDELCSFVAEQAFDHVGVFTYSHEEGTPAFSKKDDIPQRRKDARRKRLMTLQRRFAMRRQRRRVGERARILIDGPAGDERVVTGRLATQAPEIDSCVYLTDCDPSSYDAGSFVDVEIVGVHEYDLLARPVAAVDGAGTPSPGRSAQTRRSGNSGGRMSSTGGQR